MAFQLAFNNSLNARGIPVVNSLLSDACVNDRTVRNESMGLMNRLVNTGENDIQSALTDSFMLLQEQTKAINKENQILVASILKNGLPEGWSSQSYKAIWLIVDHAGLKSKKKISL